MSYRPTGNVQDPATSDELDRIAQEFAMAVARNLEVTNVAPPKPSEGEVRVADGVNWDPIGDGFKRPVWFGGGVWLAFGTGGVGGVLDHGVLTGLLDDDHTQYQLRSEKGAASGYASLDGSGIVPLAQLPPLGAAAITRDTMMFFLGI